MNISKSILLTIAMIFAVSHAIAQQGCKVLMENIQSSYEGECKNLLAHGKGTARGIDTYTGLFRKGFPNGKGTYKWSTGQSYDGDWLMGKREGVGEYHYTLEGKEAIQSGVWKNDRYLGPKPVAPKIKHNQNITSVRINKTGDGNQVIIKMIMNGLTNTEITDLSMQANSGTEFIYSGYMGFDQIVFPFTCKIIYTTPNTLHTAINHCTLEFEIAEPGRWDVRLENN